MKKPEDKGEELHIMDVSKGVATFCLVGNTPVMHNCMSTKVRRDLLLPAGRKTEADKKSTLKHVPLEEFRDSIYFNKDPQSPTLIQHLGSAFRQSMRNAALNLPGVTKAEVGRMLWIESDRVDIYGVPQIDMRIVKQAGINRTPDVRTRAIQQKWAAQVTVSFIQPQLKAQAVANLLSAAGFFIGIADGRNEKGALSYGLWRVCAPDDPDYVSIVATGGRAAQIAAMENPTPYNDETAELLSWYTEAVKTHRTFAPITKEPKETNGKGRLRIKNVDVESGEVAS
jgi:hypothetical protein